MRAPGGISTSETIVRETHPNSGSTVRRRTGEPAIHAIIYGDTSLVRATALLALCACGSLLAAGQEVELRGDRVAIVFKQMENGATLASLSDPGAGVGFLSEAGSEVWRVRFKDAKGNMSELTSGSPCSGVRFTQKGNELNVVWTGIQREGRSAFDALVHVRLPSRSRLPLWHLDVTNIRSDLAVYEVDFPCMTLRPLTAGGEGDLLADGIGTGRLIQKPFKVPYSLAADYPGGQTLQMMAFYSPGKSGLYLATEDGRGFVKSFIAEPIANGRALQLRVTHYPENRTTPGQDYSLPYNLVLGTFEGTWWAASKIYRSWALRQPWCSKEKTLWRRKDIPRWYKDLALWSIVWENWFPDADRSKLVVEGAAVPEDQVFDMGTKYYGGLEWAAHLYGWHKHHFDSGCGDYFPPIVGEEFLRKQIERFHQHNIRIVPYVNAWLVDKATDWFKQEGYRCAVKTEKGECYPYAIDHSGMKRQYCPEGHHNLTWMCAFTEDWRDKLSSICRELAGYGVDGIYLDVLCASQPQCFDPTHGHPLGGGSYSTEGARRLVEACRAAANSQRGQLAIVGEHYSEGYIGVLDGCLQGQLLPDGIPLFSSVYHDYILLWCNILNLDSASEARMVDWFHVVPAYSFIRGDQMGWYRYDTVASEYRRKLAELRIKVASKFLTYGEMLEPPALLNELPTVKTPRWYSYFSDQGERSFSAVLHSAWKAPEGTVGLIFANISHEPQHARYRFDAKRYGLVAPRGLQVARLLLEGPEVLAAYPGSSFEREDLVPPMDVVALEVRGK